MVAEIAAAAAGCGCFYPSDARSLPLPIWVKAIFSSCSASEASSTSKWTYSPTFKVNLIQGNDENVRDGGVFSTPKSPPNTELHATWTRAVLI